MVKAGNAKALVRGLLQPELPKALVVVGLEALRAVPTALALPGELGGEPVAVPGGQAVVGRQAVHLQHHQCHYQEYQEPKNL